MVMDGGLQVFKKDASPVLPCAAINCDVTGNYNSKKPLE
jgi:hypothetical protein